MPPIEVSPRSIVNQIKSLLQDRYASGYPILKELVQNADDAQARRVTLDALTGWPDADNPLLRGPGLLVVNDGVFRPEDRRGILAFGESVKATDGSAIGRFGLGQKAVFHLCDAFAVHAFDSDGSKEPHEPFSTVVNPFLGVEVDDNKAGTWDDLSAGDVSLLRAAVPADCRTRALLIWLPFRREGLRPAPDAGFFNVQPRGDRVVVELARRNDLRSLLTALRHVESIEIRDRGRTGCGVHLVDANQRLLGPERWPAGVRSFSGTVGTEPDGTRASFVGREATQRTERLHELQANEHWPRAISALSSTPEPVKGEPHGAATLLRVPPTAKSQDPDDLTIRGPCSCRSPRQRQAPPPTLTPGPRRLTQCCASACPRSTPARAGPAVSVLVGSICCCTATSFWTAGGATSRACRNPRCPGFRRPPQN